MSIWTWATLSIASTVLANSLSSPTTVTITVDANEEKQIVDGFGFSEAFGRAENVFGSAGLSPANQQRLLDLMYDENIGAGFTILRNGIGSANLSDPSDMISIELTDPGLPSSKPTYTPNNNTGQLPLAKAAYARGLKTLYADAWSAPWFMKTNLNDNDGGYLCGVEDTDCPTGSWIQAYVNYLLEYVKLYKEAGVTVTNVGFLNEPQLNTSYASMQSNGTQAAEVIRVLGRTIREQGLDLEINCCDAVGWEDAEQMLPGLQAGPDPAINYLSVYTGHGYASPPNFTLSTHLRTWLTEWADLTGDYVPYVFFNNSGPGEGMTWANNIQVAFNAANVSAFLYWEGAENATASSSLINLINNEIVLSKRYWVFAQFSKFVRPGARRVVASSSASDVFVTSFKNSNGVIATQVLNNGTSTTTIDLEINGSWGWGNREAMMYITDNEFDFKQEPVYMGSDGLYHGTIPARSLVSFITQ